MLSSLEKLLLALQGSILDMVFSNCITMMRRILLVVEMVHNELAMAASFG
jgi:hypothetical protein